MDEARTSSRAIAFYLHSGGTLDFHDADASHPDRDRPLHLTFTIRDPAMYDYIRTYNRMREAEARATKAYLGHQVIVGRPAG